MPSLFCGRKAKDCQPDGTLPFYAFPRIVMVFGTGHHGGSPKKVAHTGSRQKRRILHQICKKIEEFCKVYMAHKRINKSAAERPKVPPPNSALGNLDSAVNGNGWNGQQKWVPKRANAIGTLGELFGSNSPGSCQHQCGPIRRTPLGHFALFASRRLVVNGPQVANGQRGNSHGHAPDWVAVRNWKKAVRRVPLPCRNLCADPWPSGKGHQTCQPMGEFIALNVLLREGQKTG